MGLKLTVVVSLIALAGAQFLPENTCPEYFQYVNDPFSGLQGEITLPTLPQGRINVRFWQLGNNDASAVGNLNPYPDDQAIKASRGPYRFRVSLRWNPPKLTLLSINGQLLCSAREDARGQNETYFNRFYVIFRTEPLSPFPAIVPNPIPRGSPNVDVQSIFYSTNEGDFVPGFRQPWRSSAARGASLKPQLASPAPTPAEVFWQTPSRFVPPTPPLVATNSPPIATSPPVIVSNPPPAAPPQNLIPRTSSSPLTCGREGSLVPFIVRGKEYPRGQYPWLSAVFHKVTRSLSFKCGGSLISASIVISAAHCVHRMSENNVVIGLGRYDLEDYAEEGAEMRNVRRLLWHPEYSTRSYSDADIALITIERPVTFSDIIAPICMWTVEASSTASSSGFIAGWGRDESDSRTQYPRVVEAEIASPTVCASTWRGSMMVTDRSLCAGNRDGSGPCLGDSGGGLMVKQGDRWLLRGIVSIGERGPSNKCQLNQYVLYCDLSKHIDWINDNIR
ncbi:brain-specific serine protease 4 isoform X1 [Drosophila biarmipes]|uniref:brain-specific serine protease 4 isoform X1 n=2 Tax=Drosophila biarmipes TaxID=125945 RepID=UPI0007E81178|nr:brain-specific serine protease 4 isoform X1 [Drosophila biarmipes]